MDYLMFFLIVFVLISYFAIIFAVTYTNENKKNDNKIKNKYSFCYLYNSMSIFENIENIGWCNYDEASLLFQKGLSPLTSDMVYLDHENLKPLSCGSISISDNGQLFTRKTDTIPCWSLGALLKILESFNGKYEHKIDYVNNRISYEAVDDEIPESMEVLKYTDGKRLVEACVKMIVWHLDVCKNKNI